MNGVVIYDALNLEDLDLLAKYWQDKQILQKIFKDYYIPSPKFITKTNSYYEHWVKLLTAAASEPEGAIILGSYVTEFMAIAPSLGKQSQLSDDEFSFLEELVSEIGARRVLVTPGPFTDKEIVTRIASSFSKKFPNFSGAESPKIFSTMMSLEDRGYDIIQLSSIVTGMITPEKKEAGKPLTIDKTVKKEEYDTMNFPSSFDNEKNAEVAEDVFFRLEMANAINDVLSKRIIKKQGGAYDEIEKYSREYLKSKLEGLFQPVKPSDLSQEDISLVKTFVKQLKNKMETKK